MKLVVATHNVGKLAELRRLLPGIDVIGLDEAAPALTDIPETGGTYLENATLKARAGARASGLPALGDDSGLEVDALGGAPGLHSARYSGGGAKLNVEKLLTALQGRTDRSARFRCTLVVAFPDERTPLIVAEGTCEGAIDAAPRGDNGFGYDPVFVPRGDRLTMAELDDEEKDAISHRGHACRGLVAKLR